MAIPHGELTDGHWLSVRRLRVMASLALACFLVAGFYLVTFSNFVNPKGYRILTDHIVFWEASKMALQGHPVDAYNPEIMMSAVAHDDAVRKNFGWFYPPGFFLLILPLGLLTFHQAFAAFMGVTLAFYVAVMRRIVSGQDALLFLASFSGLWCNLRAGQNGFLTAALAGAALLLLEKRPILAGVFIGLLSIKPHLLLLFPLALIAGRSWAALLSAAITAAALMVAGTAVLGIDTLTAWLGSIQKARTMYLESGWLPLAMASPFSAFRILGWSIKSSYMGQLVFSVYAALSVWKVWRSSASANAKYATLAAATFLATPYVFFYDLTWLALIIAWVSKSALEGRWFFGDREILVFAWAMPLMSYMSIWFHGLVLVQLIIPLLLFVALRHAGLSVLLSRR
ncbi:MAG: DUF2029 domain-containing protein [Betaproteobacteria bacterium]|nr:DUF2029 domain-containing protein [Betaproteobacteria bacterium]